MQFGINCDYDCYLKETETENYMREECHANILVHIEL